MPTPFPERFSVLICPRKGGAEATAMLVAVAVHTKIWASLSISCISYPLPPSNPLVRIWAPARVGDFASLSLNRKWSLVCRCPACAFPHPVSLAHAPLSRPSLLRAPLLYIDWYPLSFRTNRYFAQSPLGLAQGEREGGGRTENTHIIHLLNSP